MPEKEFRCVSVTENHYTQAGPTQNNKLKIDVINPTDLISIEVKAYHSFKSNWRNRLEKFLGHRIFSPFSNSSFYWDTDRITFELKFRQHWQGNVSADVQYAEIKADHYAYFFQFDDTDHFEKHKLVNSLVRELKEFLNEDAYHQLVHVTRRFHHDCHPHHKHPTDKALKKHHCHRYRL